MNVMHLSKELTASDAAIKLVEHLGHAQAHKVVLALLDAGHQPRSWLLEVIDTILTLQHGEISADTF